MRKHLTLMASVAIFVLLYGIACVRYEGFASPGVFLNLLKCNSFLGIVAVGMTFVILSGGIDLSVGAVMSLSSVLIGVLIMDCRWPAVPAILVTLLAGTVLGLLTGGTVHLTGLQPFIVTLAAMFFARGLGFLIHLESIAINDPVHERIAAAGIPLGPYTLSLNTLIFAGSVLASAYVLLFTRFGRDVYAIGGNEEAARLMGRPVGRTKVAVYAISGFCAALAGAALTFDLSSGNHAEGVGMELNAIAAVVIGGTLLTGGVGSIFGTFVGVLTIGLILNIVTTQESMVSSGWTKVAIGAFLLAAVLLQRLLSRGAARGATLNGAI